MKRNKIVILATFIAILLIVVVGVAYASFTYSNMSSNSQLVVGDIYMHYKESNAINLSGIMPGGEYNIGDADSYFEFTISGKNTYTKEDIWYDIVLSHGDVPDGKEESNRIIDKYLKFRLVEVTDGIETELLRDETYDDLTSERIYVAQIPKDTTTEINKTYRLYMVVRDELIIGNTEDAVYTTDEWANAFASIKVNVTGDFDEKVVATNLVKKVKASYGTEGGVIAINTDGELYDANDPTQTIREYRYSGASVNNYVTYNNETWRIIGIFSEELEDGTTEEYVKIVRNSMLASGSMPTSYYIASQDNTYTIASSSTSQYAYWNKPATLKSTNSNDWTTAGLMYYLNTEQDDTADTPNAGYLSTLTSGAKNLIRTTTYYLGNYKSNTDTAITGYTSERTASQIWSGNQPTWTGKVALMYPSDYGYSADSSYWTSIPYNWKNAESDGIYARSTSWLYTKANHTTYEWLLSPSSNASSLAMCLNASGTVSYNYAYGYGVRPVVNLISEVKTTIGDGSESSPYTILES